MYVDNKDYPCVTRGGKLVAFVLVDLKTLAIFKVDVRSKKHNGLALRKLVSENGVHKLPYKRTLTIAPRWLMSKRLQSQWDWISNLSHPMIKV